jgi:hypothetical protein
MSPKSRWRRSDWPRLGSDLNAQTTAIHMLPSDLSALARKLAPVKRACNAEKAKKTRDAWRQCLAQPGLKSLASVVPLGDDLT